MHLPSPGVAGSAESAEVLRQYPFVAETMSLFDEITVALIGIGAIEPSRLLASSGNVFSSEALRGGFANVLITDLRTAQRLAEEPE